MKIVYNNAEIQPINGYLIVEKCQREEEGEIVLPETAQERAGKLFLKVIATDKDSRANPGDIVICMSLTKMGLFKYQDKEWLIISEKEVGCVIKEKGGEKWR